MPRCGRASRRRGRRAPPRTRWFERRCGFVRFYGGRPGRLRGWGGFGHEGHEETRRGGAPAVRVARRLLDCFVCLAVFVVILPPTVRTDGVLFRFMGVPSVTGVGRLVQPRPPGRQPP